MLAALIDAPVSSGYPLLFILVGSESAGSVGVGIALLVYLARRILERLGRARAADSVTARNPDAAAPRLFPAELDGNRS